MQYIVLLFKNRLIRRKEVRILFQKSRNFHLKICRGKVDKDFPIKILIKKTKGRKIRRELSKYSKNNRMTFDDASKLERIESLLELLSLSLNNSVVRVRERERKRERKIVRTLSNQDAMQYNALVRLLNWVKGDCMAYLILDLHKAS